MSFNIRPLIQVSINLGQNFKSLNNFNQNIIIPRNSNYHRLKVIQEHNALEIFSTKIPQTELKHLT